MAESSGADAAKKELVRKPPIETASWCYRDKEDDVHHDFAWTITNFSRKINVVPNSECCCGQYVELETTRQVSQSQIRPLLGQMVS